jgi:hypothetical protein
MLSVFSSDIIRGGLDEEGKGKWLFIYPSPSSSQGVYRRLDLLFVLFEKLLLAFLSLSLCLWIFLSA